jgi:hypothetical protein
VRQRSRRTVAGRECSADILAWPKTKGIALSGRGRIPDDVVEQYAAVTGGRSVAAGYQHDQAVARPDHHTSRGWRDCLR